MKFERLLKKVSDLSCFTTRFLSAGEDLNKVRLQLSRWVKDGRLIKLHKGVYTLAEPYRKITPESFVIANTLKSPSYVSLQSALAWHGLIPESVPMTSSITTVRTKVIETPLGLFEYRHIKKSLFWGYKKFEISNKQKAFVAKPEKALLDLIYLTPGGDSLDFIESLRLQNFEKISLNLLRDFAGKPNSPKLKRATSNIKKIIDKGEGVTL